MTAIDARARLERLVKLRVEVAHAARAEDVELMRRLGEDVRASRDAFVGHAVGEIASFRAQLSGPQVG